MLVGFVAITFPQGRPRAGPRRRSWRAKVLRHSAWHGETHRDCMSRRRSCHGKGSPPTIFSPRQDAPSRASNTEQCGFASQVTFPAEMGLVKVSMLPRAPDHPARARPPLRRLRRHDRDRIRLSALYPNARRCESTGRGICPVAGASASRSFTTPTRASTYCSTYAS